MSNTINWPLIAIGSGTGTTYTSTEGYLWTWTGNRWDGVLGNSLGGFLKPWVIFSSLGVPTVYDTLKLAMIAAVSGQTIHLYGSAVEESSGIILKDGVDINFNGNTYYLDNGPSNGFLTFYNDTTTIKCRMYNGTVHRLSGAPSTRLIDNSIITSSFEFYGMKFKNTGGICGVFTGSLKGGSFYSDTTIALAIFPGVLSGNLPADIMIEDAYGEGSNCHGIFIQYNSSYDTKYTFSNLVGISIVPTGSSEVLNHGGIIINNSGLGRFELIDCIGYSSSSVGWGIGSQAIYNLNTLTLNGCYGISRGTGIRSDRTNLYNCIAEGSTDAILNNNLTKSAFYDSRSSNYYGCADSQPFNTDFTGAPFPTGISMSLLSMENSNRNIENCAFTGGEGIVGISSPAFNFSTQTISIKNTTIRGLGSSKPIDFNYASYHRFNIIGNVLTGGNLIRLSGATGGDIHNNVLISSSFGNAANTTPSGVNGNPQNFAGNTALDCQFNFSLSGFPQKLTQGLLSDSNLFY